jgi:hypothetical protein
MSRRSWILRGLVVVGLAAAVNVLLDLVSRRHDVALVTLAVVCLVAALGLVADATGSTTGVSWSVDRLADTRPVRSEATLASYERLVERHWTSRDPDTALQRALLALAERKLGQAGGPEDTHQESLRAALGPDLSVLTDPRPHRLGAARISRIIDRIEEL